MSEVQAILGTAERESISHLKTSLDDGVDWPTAMLEAMEEHQVTVEGITHPLM